MEGATGRLLWICCTTSPQSSSTIANSQAAARYWPEVFSTEQAAHAQAHVLQGMRIVRPVVETGYENIVQARLLLDGITPEEMLATWHTMLPKAMKQLNLDRGEMVALFGRVRDEWMAEDLQGWLSLNSMYDGVAAPVRGAQQQAEVYIVTTKQVSMVAYCAMGACTTTYAHHL